jgi:cytochrome c oxidase assembly factor CtaG
MEQEPRHYGFREPTAPIMTVGSWVVTMLILCIPIVNIIMLIVWAAGSDDNPNRKNWAIAQLIFFVIGIVLWIVLFGSFMGVMSSMLN